MTSPPRVPIYQPRGAAGEHTRCLTLGDGTRGVRYGLRWDSDTSRASEVSELGEYGR
jgi:hypothetical protein